MTADVRKKHRSWGWSLLLVALVFGFGGWAGYSTYQDHESGKTVRTSRRAHGFYEAFGTTGWLVLGIGGGLGCLGVGVWRLVRGYGPDPGAPTSTAGRPGRHSDRCPHCRGELTAGATFCRHCKRWLN